MATGTYSGALYYGTNQASLPTPAGGDSVLGFKADKLLYWKDDAGVEHRAASSASALTSGRVPYATTGGLLTDSANLTFSGTTLTAHTLTVSTGNLTVSAGNLTVSGVVGVGKAPLAGTAAILVAGSTDAEHIVARFGTNNNGASTAITLQFVEDEDGSPSELGRIRATHAPALEFMATGVTAQLTVSASGVVAAGNLTVIGTTTFGAALVKSPGIIQVTGASGVVDPAAQGVEFRGGATPSLTAYNRGGAVYLPMIYDALAHTFSTGNVTIDANLTVSGDSVVVGGTGTDSASKILVRGTNASVRLGTAGTVATVEGVDNTGTSAYRPLWLGGSTTALTITGVEKLSIDASGNTTLAGNLTVGGTGPHAIGGATLTNTQYHLTGSFTAGAGSGNYGLLLTNTITTAANQSAYCAALSGTLVEAGSGTHADFAQLLLFAPTITPGVADVTNASTLKIVGAPTAAINNYALWVAAGNTLLGGNLTVSGAGSKFGNGAATASQVLMVNRPDGQVTKIQIFQDGRESWTMGMDPSSAVFRLQASNVDMLTVTNAGAATLAGNLTVSGGTVTTGSTTALSLATTGGTQAKIINVASAVNFIEIFGGAAGSGVVFAGRGADTDINFSFNAKGAGAYRFRTADGGTEQLRIIHVASAVNAVQLGGGAIGNGIRIEPVGTDTNIPIWYASKGTGVHDFYTNGPIGGTVARQFQITHTASADRYLTITGGVAGSGTNATIGVSGGDVEFSAPIDAAAGLRRRIATDVTGLSGGTANNLGANIQLYGQSHATLASVIQFRGGGDERARITAGGYLKASNSGTYANATAPYHEFVSNDSAEPAARITNLHASTPNGLYVQYLNAAPNGTGNHFLFCQDSGATRAEIRSNGGLANYQANDVNLCDMSAKIIIGESPDYTEFVSGLKYHRSKYLDGDRWLDQPTAQEMPDELQAKWNDDYMGIYPEQLQARINSVIPKLIQRIKQLEARI
jgi:fibronectin-binding autotransporter adhesin